MAESSSPVALPATVRREEPRITTVTLTKGAEHPGDPAWRAARALYGSRPLLRIVDAASGSDQIVPLTALKDYVELLLDGCCLYKPHPPSSPERPPR
jgi:hypothetical protein